MFTNDWRGWQEMRGAWRVVMTLIGLLREDVDWALRGSGMPIEVRRELEELQEVLMKIQDCIE